MGTNYVQILLQGKELNYNSQVIRFFILVSTLIIQMGFQCYIAQVLQNMVRPININDE